MSVEDFKEYYEKRHVPLACSFEGPLDRYRRNYVIDKALGLADCDCITEVWYDLDGRWADRHDSVVSPEMAQIIAEDEAQFLDRAATRIVIVEESESHLAAAART